MSTIERKVFLFLSLCGIAASIVACIESLSGVTIVGVSRWEIALGVGAFVVYIPIAVIERSRFFDRTFSLKEFARGMPRWVVPGIMSFWLITLAHFVWFIVKNGGGVPEFLDGHYVLDNHGRIKVLTQPEYVKAKSEELRLFASWIVIAYLMPAIYWWHPRNRPTD